MSRFTRAFVKVALNAAEMRALAKKIGLVTDDATPWRKALAQMLDVKDKAGNVLKKGKTLREMGVPPSELIWTLASHTDDYGKEFVSRYRPGSGKMAPVIRGDRSSSYILIPASTVKTLEAADVSMGARLVAARDTAHTHPGMLDRKKFKNFKAQIPEAGPSNQDLDTYRKIEALAAKIRLMRKGIKNPSEEEVARRMPGMPKSLHAVIAPDAMTLSVTSLRPKSKFDRGARTIYFDMPTILNNGSLDPT